MRSIATLPRRAPAVGKKRAATRSSPTPSKARPSRKAPAERGLLPHILEGEVCATVAAHTARRIQVQFIGDQAFTTGKLIVLPALPRDRLIPFRAAMEIRGYTHHERLHIEESDFEALEPFLQQFAHNRMMQHIAQRFHNAIEDMRIERIGTAKFAGVKTALDYACARANAMSAAALRQSPMRLAIPAFVGPVAITWIGRKLMGFPTPSNDQCLAMLPAHVRQRVDQWAPEVMAVTTTDDAFDLAKRLAEATFKDLPPLQQQARPDSDQQGAQGDSSGQDGQPSSHPDQTDKNDKSKAADRQPQAGQTQSSPSNGAGSGKPDQPQSGNSNSPANHPSQPDCQDNGTGDAASQAGQGAPGQQQSAAAGTGAAGQPTSACPVEPSLVPTFADMGITIKESPDGIPVVVLTTAKNGKPLDVSLRGPQTMMVGRGSGYSPGKIETITIHAPASQTAQHKFILPRMPRSGSRQYDYRVLAKGEIAEAMADVEGRERYLEIKRAVAATTANAVMALRRSLMARLNIRWRSNREDGALDARRLADIITGSTTIYRQRVEAPRLDTAVTLLIDNSGSMMDHLHLCQELGYVLTETFRGTPIKSEIIGFTDGDTDLTPEDQAKLEVAQKLSGAGVRHTSLNLYLFKGYDDSPAAGEIPIGNMTNVPLGGTPTAPSILAVVPRLHARPERRKVLIVITDGLSDHDEIKAALAFLDQLGIAVVAIGIRCKDVHKSFKRAVVLNEVSDLSGTILKQLGDMLAPEGH